MNTLPLTVLVSEGPLARAYLATMRRAGLRPRRIILMVQSRHPRTGKPVPHWLPSKIRMHYAERLQTTVQNHWPRWIRMRHPELVNAITRELAKVCVEPAERVADMLGSLWYGEYAESFERILVEGLADPLLWARLEQLGPETILYTGGGLVPSGLLAIEGLKWLHVHPGHLPEVRGADGLLWSVLVHGRPGMSCFRMDRGVDTGEVIATAEWPPLRFDLTDVRRPDDQTLYRAIFCFCDPILRASFLVDSVLRPRCDAFDLSAVPQDTSKGVTYHFMHPTLRRRALERVFVS